MITTFDSNCMKCLRGDIHPWHDDGKPAVVPDKRRNEELSRMMMDWVTDSDDTSETLVHEGRR